jgi:hypothetical protein
MKSWSPGDQWLELARSSVSSPAAGRSISVIVGMTASTADGDESSVG